MSKPGERRKGETQEAWEAFVAYRDMGAERSHVKVSQQLGKSAQLMARWSRRWEWVERVKDWDDEIDRQARQAQIKAIKEMQERHIKQAMALQTKAIQRLTKMDKDELSPRDVLAYLTEATKLERLSRGEPETVAETRGRVEESHEFSFKITQNLAADPNVIDAIQHAIREREAGTDLSGGAGLLDRGLHGRQAVVEATRDNAGGGTIPARRGGEL